MISVAFPVVSASGTVAWVLVSTLCFAPSIASAAPPSDDGKHAVELFDQSAAAYDAGQFARAAELLKEAYKLRPDPVLLYNLARAYEGMGALPDAVQAYADFLAADPTAKDRGAIEARIATLRAQIDEQSRLQREAADRERERHRETPHPSGVSPIPWIVAGVGGAGLVTGAVFGALSIARHNAANSDAQAYMDSDQSQARSFAAAANIAFIAGGVLAAAGITWGIVDLGSSRSAPDRAPPAVSLQIGPASAWLTVRTQ
jgi:tetratricopeptide (TPR) repeat protein